MEELKVFENAEFGSVRTTTVNGEIMFVGKDVAEILGYSNPRKAIIDHIDEEDKLRWQIADTGQKRETYLINESISSLERRLGSEGFIRVHRSYLVNLEDVHNVEIGSTGLMELRLDRVSSTVPVSRRRAAEVKSHLGLA